jgi:hypothetical protein
MNLSSLDLPEIPEPVRDESGNWESGINVPIDKPLPEPKSLSVYIEECKKRIAELICPPFKIALDGTAIYPQGYDPDTDLDRIKLEYFLSAINYDPRFTEKILSEKNTEMREEILKMNIGNIIMEQCHKTNRF